MPCRGSCKLPVHSVSAFGGIYKAMETASIVLCLQRPPAAPLIKPNLKNSFVISIMDQLYHNSGLQGAPCELPMRVPRNLPPLAFSCPEVPTNNMYQTNWGTKETPNPFLEPIDEGSSTSPAAAKHMADFLPIFASCIQYRCMEYASRDAPIH